MRQVIQAIAHYRTGKEEFLPKISLDEKIEGEEFSHLVLTFNSLIDRIQKQIAYLTKQREETEEVLESIGEGIIATDSSAQITFMNRAACQMLSISSEKILKKNLKMVLSDSEELVKKCDELIVHALQTSEPVGDRWIVKDALYLDLAASPLMHKDGALLVMKDKTSDYRIVELGKEFIANASHELKTPITIIRGFAETLQDLPNLSREMMMEITEKIVKTCERLDKLVKSLLTLADIENFSHDRFQKMDLEAALENCIHHLRSLSPEAKIEASLQKVHILADADLMELALMNVLENAVRYSQKNPLIQIEIKQEKDQILLRIKDQGIGMSAKDLPHIFERFFTADRARSKKSGGTGLGLSIVKMIAEKHQAKVLVESDLGKGSCFTFVFQPCK